MGALGHDAGHFAASRKAWINDWGVWAMSLICNPVMWQHQHTYSHHSFTNEVYHDPDMHHFKWIIRVSDKFIHEWPHSNQSNVLFVMFAYLFTVFGTCFYIPLNVIDAGTIYGCVNWQDKDRPIKAIGMQVHFVAYVLFIMIVPLFTNDSVLKGLVAVIVHISTLGLEFAIFSQINHLTEAAHEADMITRRERRQECLQSEKSQLVNSWAAAQIETSNNFASQSILWHILSNGLNHQIEHHLFPGLNHCHLHHIAPVVRDTCEEYGVKYVCYDTWSDLFGSMLAWYNHLSVGAFEEK